MNQHIFSPAEFFGHAEVAFALEIIFALTHDGEILRPTDVGVS